MVAAEGFFFRLAAAIPGQSDGARRALGAGELRACGRMGAGRSVRRDVRVFSTVEFCGFSRCRCVLADGSFLVVEADVEKTGVSWCCLQEISWCCRKSRSFLVPRLCVIYYIPLVCIILIYVYIIYVYIIYGYIYIYILDGQVDSPMSEVEKKIYVSYLFI